MHHEPRRHHTILAMPNSDVLYHHQITGGFYFDLSAFILVEVHIKIIYYIYTMKKKENIPKLFSIRELSRLSGVPYSKIYHTNVETYESLTDQDKTEIFNEAHKKWEILAAYLGFTVEGKRIKKV